jgi:hypothetical protein
MGSFEYVAKTPVGDELRGVLRAPTRATAAQVLAGMGLTPLRIDPQPPVWRRALRWVARRFGPPKTLRAQPDLRVDYIPYTPPRTLAPVFGFPPVQVIRLPVAGTPPWGVRPPRDKVEAAVASAAAAAATGDGSPRSPIDRIDEALQKFVPDDLHDAERESWFFYSAWAAAARRDSDEAMIRLEGAYKIYPSSVRIRLALANEHQRRGQVQSMLELLDGADVTAEPGAALISARFAYLWDEPDRGLQYLRPLLNAYRNLDASDIEQLVARQLPSIQVPAMSVVAMFFLKGNVADAIPFLRAATEGVRGADFGGIEHWVRCRADGKMSQFVADVRKKFEQSLEPNGAPRLQLAIMESQLQPAREVAAQKLNGLIISPADLPWLQDVRLLANCELAARFGDAEREAFLRADFFGRQPILLAPEVALYFNLLDYQESAKQHYHATRGGNGGGGSAF